MGEEEAMRHPTRVHASRELFTREQFMGTWAAIAVIVEVLIECGVLAREEVLEPLSAAEAVLGDDREIAIRGVRLLLERLAEFPAPDATAGDGKPSPGGRRKRKVKVSEAG
jgi:hypothetical protein